MKKRNISKTGLVLVGSMLVCLLICLAVLIPKGGLGGDAAEDLNDENTPDLKTVMEGSSPLLIFDKRPEAQALITAYEEGQIEQVTIRSASEASAGQDKEVTVNTPNEVKELYRLLKNITVTEEASADAAETISLTFELEDGTECAYGLSGDSIIVIGDAAYEAAGTEALLAEIGKLE